MSRLEDEVFDEDKMSETEKKLFKKLVDNSFLAMDELRAILMKARDAENPLGYDEDVLAKHDALGESLKDVMLSMGFDAEEDEQEDTDEGE